MLIIAPGQENNRDIFSILFNMNLCFVFSLESPHRSDCNKRTQYTIFSMNKNITLNYLKSAVTKGLKNEFERAVGNEPSVFEPMKFYCILT